LVRVSHTQSTYCVHHTRRLCNFLTPGSVMASEADDRPIPLLPTRYKGLDPEELALTLRSDLYRVYRAAPHHGLIGVAQALDAALEELSDGFDDPSLGREPVVPPTTDLLLKKVYDVALVGRPQLEQEVEEGGREAQLPLIRLVPARKD
jgi:hypothetical protein